ncbi:MAG: hypothetical protein NVS3B7_11720 [Candidatus Elarobacter sp.]
MGGPALCLLSGMIATSVASENAPGVAPAGAGAVAPCRVDELAGRVLEGDGAATTVFALRNRGPQACRIAGNVGVRLLDERGTPYPIQTAPRATMAMLLTLASGREASFSLGYTRAIVACPSSAFVEVYVPPQPDPIRVQAHVPACTGTGAPQLRVSNLRLGLPPAPVASPVPVARIPARPPALPSCRASDFTVRDDGADTSVGDGRFTAEAFVLHNDGSACTLSGYTRAIFLDAGRNPMPVRFAVRNTLAIMLSVPPGGETAFTVAYASGQNGAARCPASASISITLDEGPPAIAPAAIPICAASTAQPLHVSNMRLLRSAASAAPAATPTQ